MNRSKELLIIRYMSFIILIAEVLSKGKSNYISSIIFILLFIINNNLRVFFFKNDKFYIVSIAIELISIAISYLNFGGNILFYLINFYIFDNNNI